MRVGIAMLVSLVVFSSNIVSAWGMEDSGTRGTQEMPAPSEPAGDGGPRSVPPASEPPAQEPDEMRFAVKAYMAEGNTLISPEKLDQIFAPYRGTAQRIEDVEKARAALEKAYHDLGYPTIFVVTPEQSVEGGVVRFSVIESKLGEIKVTGNRYASAENILAKMPSLRSGALLHEPTFIKELESINTNPDLQVAPILKQGIAPGTADLELKVKDRLPLHGKLEANNRATPNTSPTRLNGSLQYTNLFDRDHILTLQTTQTPEDLGAIQVYGFSYVAPIKWPDYLLSVYGAISKSKSVLDGSSLPISAGDINVVGDSTVVGARYIFPVATGGQMYHQLSVGLDYKRIGRSEARFPGDLGNALVANRVNYAPVSVGYA
ncbi:MAG TPA: POTRA domain-containing protein, partial [Nitrospiraceae bacterium]|nr:POTRA domain-containing protein [Nitrospiraceae bacterium]